MLLFLHPLYGGARGGDLAVWPDQAAAASTGADGVGECTSSESTGAWIVFWGCHHYCASTSCHMSFVLGTMH